MDNAKLLRSFPHRNPFAKQALNPTYVQKDFAKEMASQDTLRSKMRSAYLRKSFANFVSKNSMIQFAKEFAKETASQEYHKKRSREFFE